MIKIYQDFTINIRNLKAKTIIGMLEEEKQSPQEIIIDIKIIFNGLKSAKSDQIKDTIDYFEITKLVKEEVEKTSFELLEKLLEFILRIIMAFDLAKEAKVTIHKPKALEDFGAIVSLSAKATNTNSYL